jgi:hypothetical protein
MANLTYCKLPQVKVIFNQASCDIMVGDYENLIKTLIIDKLRQLPCIQISGRYDYTIEFDLEYITTDDFKDYLVELFLENHFQLIIE